MILVCTDGFWSGLDDEQIARLSADDAGLAENLSALGEVAVLTNGPHSDNTSAAALRWTG